MLNGAQMRPADSLAGATCCGCRGEAVTLFRTLFVMGLMLLLPIFFFSLVPFAKPPSSKKLGDAIKKRLKPLLGAARRFIVLALLHDQPPG